MDKEINGYKLFRNEDDAIYIAKSKEDLLKFYIDLIGEDEVVNIHGSTDEFIFQLVEIDLTSDYANKEFKYLDENSEFNATGEDHYIATTFYKDYKDWAEKDQGTQVLFDLSGY